MTRRHHTVPQMYLRGFADSAGQIMLVHRDDPARTHRIAVKKALAEVGFYRIEKDELASSEDRTRFDAESVETALSAVEGAARPVLNKLATPDSGRLTDMDWYRLLQFVALQTTRGNRWRTQVTSSATRIAKQHVLRGATTERVRDHLISQKMPHEPDDIAAHLHELETNFPRIVPPKGWMVQTSMKMAFGVPGTDDIGLSRFLAEKSLRVIRPSQTTVISSDEPVQWWAPGHEQVPYAQAVVVWLPLSRHSIVQLRDPAFDLAANGLPTDDDRLTAFVNDLSGRNAYRWIIHHPEDSDSYNPQPVR